MNWRLWVKKYGIGRLASTIGLSYGAVRKYAAGISVPDPDNCHKLTAVARDDLLPVEFREFHASLCRDLTGVDPP